MVFDFGVIGLGGVVDGFDVSKLDVGPFGTVSLG
jgi:hypothetical protein